MKVACLQMDVAFCRPEENFSKASKMIEKAMGGKPDVLVLPEAWNTGFFPKENLERLCDEDCRRVKDQIGALAKTYGVNIVAGSVSNLRQGKVYNTACVLDRSGTCIAQYDKTHLFTSMGEDAHYTPGLQLCRFKLDGVSCGIVICYDLRFPELIRTLALPGLDVLFVVAQWPKARASHLNTLAAARAIENQMFVVLCNSCGTAGETVYGGNSAIYDPWGNVLARAGEQEMRICEELDFVSFQTIRQSIHIFRDRRPELYKI